MILREDFKSNYITLDVGTEVFRYNGPDYGISKIDTIYLGENYVSVTLVPNELPFFTIPERLLNEEG